MTTTRYFLDTNILVQFVRNSNLWQQIRDTYQPLVSNPTPFISVVSIGELRSLAIQWHWGDQKLEQVEFCLSFFQSQTIDNPTLIRAYATIDAYAESIGESMGKNDHWIAATAAVTGSCLLTTDRDFDKLHSRFLQRIWIDPAMKF